MTEAVTSVAMTRPHHRNAATQSIQKVDMAPTVTAMETALISDDFRVEA